MSPTPLSFLGGVDASSGRIVDPDSAARGRSVRGKVLCFPYGRGSTVGSYAIYQLGLAGKAPKAIVNRSAEPIIATGAIISGIPMVDGIDTSLIETGDKITVDATSGIVELAGVSEHHVVTSILRHKGRILLLQRSGDVGSYQGRWAGVSGFIEPGEESIDAARREVAEEVGVSVSRPTRSIAPQSFRSGDRVWVVHPYLFDLKARRVSTDWEHDEHRWVSPEELYGFDTVPGLGVVVKKLLEGPSP